MNKIPEIDLKVETKTIKGGKTYKMTVRNMFYHGFRGKITCMWLWLIHLSSKETFKEYLDSYATYKMEYDPDINAYHSIDAEKTLADLLIKELEKLKEDK